MAALNLLAVDNTAADSGDFVVAQGESATICLKGVTNAGAEVQISLKDDANDYTVIGKISYTSRGGQKAVCISAPGTYRVSRVAGGLCGVFRA